MANANRNRLSDLKWLAGLAAMALLLAQPHAAAQGAARAMVRWYSSVAPALFPFLALLPLLTCREASMAYERLLALPMRVLFDLPGAAAPIVIVGLAAGTPAGALAARRVAARAGLNCGQLQRLAAAVAGFSPAFLIGGIGVGLLNSAGLGWKLLAAQLLTQVTLALLLRRRWATRTDPVPPVETGAEARPIQAAALTLLSICGYMALFGALAEAVGAFVGPGPANVLLCVLDVPSGAARLAEYGLPEAIRLPLLAGMCGFGGICVVAQSLGALRNCGVRPGEYLALRVLAGVLSAGYVALLRKLPDLKAVRLGDAIRKNPLAAGALAAALLALPILKRWSKAIS